MDRQEIQENLYKLHEVAVLYRRRLERAGAMAKTSCELSDAPRRTTNESRIEYMKKDLKDVEEDIEKLHVIWDNLKN